MNDAQGNSKIYLARDRQLCPQESTNRPPLLPNCKTPDPLSKMLNLDWKTQCTSCQRHISLCPQGPATTSQPTPEKKFKVHRPPTPKSNATPEITTHQKHEDPNPNLPPPFLPHCTPPPPTRSSSASSRLSPPPPRRHSSSSSSPAADSIPPWADTPDHHRPLRVSSSPRPCQSVYHPRTKPSSHPPPPRRGGGAPLERRQQQRPPCRPSSPSSSHRREVRAPPCRVRRGSRSEPGRGPRRGRRGRATRRPGETSWERACAASCKPTSGYEVGSHGCARGSRPLAEVAAEGRRCGRWVPWWGAGWARRGRRRSRRGSCRCRRQSGRREGAGGLGSGRRGSRGRRRGRRGGTGRTRKLWRWWRAGWW